MGFILNNLLQSREKEEYCKYKSLWIWRGEGKKPQKNHLNFVINFRRIKLTTFKLLFNIVIWRNNIFRGKKNLVENLNISEFSMAEQSELKP